MIPIQISQQILVPESSFHKGKFYLQNPSESSNSSVDSESNVRVM